MKLSAVVAVVTIAMLFGSCTKNNSLQPPVADQSATVEEQSFSAAALAARKVSTGVYKISKFTDTGDDETPQFKGYTFEFKSGGVLVATTNTGTIFNGTYRLNSAQTKLVISISGNNALKDLDDDDWKVDAITSVRIRISAPGPDSVVFVKI